MEEGKKCATPKKSYRKSCKIASVVLSVAVAMKNYYQYVYFTSFPLSDSRFPLFKRIVYIIIIECMYVFNS